MNYAFKLFDFKGSPIYLKYWFFVLLLIVPVNMFFSIFLGVLLHELAHIYVAKKLNYRVGSVNIDILYGSAEIGYISDHVDNILVSIAGPISNLLLVIIGSSLNYFIPLDFFETMIEVNFFIFLFNILPIYPLDGGRISKSLFSMLFGNMRGMFYNGILSFIFSIFLFIYSISSGMMMLTIFSIFFAYLSYKEIDMSKS